MNKREALREMKVGEWRFFPGVKSSAEMRTWRAAATKIGLKISIRQTTHNGESGVMLMVV